MSGSTVDSSWLDGQTEPTAWNSTLTDTAVTTAGQLFFLAGPQQLRHRGPGRLIDDLTLKDGT